MKGWSGCAKLCPSGSLRMPHSTHTYRDVTCAEMCALVLPRYAHRGQTTCVKERVLHVRQSAPEGVTPHVYRNMPFRLAKVCPNGSRHTATLKPYYQNSVFKAVFFCPAIVGAVFVSFWTVDGNIFASANTTNAFIKLTPEIHTLISAAHIPPFPLIQC